MTKTKSLSLHGLHKKFQRCQSRTNKLRPPETSPLWKNSCRVRSSICQAEASARARASAYVHAPIDLILQSFRCEPCQLSTADSYPLCVSQMKALSQRFVWGKWAWDASQHLCFRTDSMLFVELNGVNGNKVLRFCRGHSHSSD